MPTARTVLSLDCPLCETGQHDKQNHPGVSGDWRPTGCISLTVFPAVFISRSHVWYCIMA